MNLKALSSAGYKRLADIVEKLQMEDRMVDPLSLYAYELALMCYAKYFFAWGLSTSHAFITHCRKPSLKAQIDITYIDSVLFDRHDRGGSGKNSMDFHIG